MKGLVVKSPWIELILEGKKTWEIRSSNIKIRGKIALMKSGSGQILGTVELVDCKKLSIEEYQNSIDKHCIAHAKEKPSRYANPHAWVLQNPVKLKKPIPYKHPPGAIIWVNLGEQADILKTEIKDDSHVL